MLDYFRLRPQIMAITHTNAQYGRVLTQRYILRVAGGRSFKHIRNNQELPQSAGHQSLNMQSHVLLRYHAMPPISLYRVVRPRSTKRSMTLVEKLAARCPLTVTSPGRESLRRGRPILLSSRVRAEAVPAAAPYCRDLPPHQTIFVY